MDKDPYLRRQGALLKNLRKGKKLTQEQLANGICSTKQLGEIERGNAEPSPTILYKLLFVLGVDYEEFMPMLYGKDMRLFNQDFARIWDAGYDEDYQQMSVLLTALWKQPYCDKNIPVVNQALLLCKCVLLSNFDKNDEAALPLLYDALRLTAPSIISGDNAINLKRVTTCIFSMNEYRILKIIANILDDLGEGSKALELHKALITSLERETTHYEIQKKLLPTIYFNVSNIWLNKDSYDNALVFANQGLDFSIATKEFKVLGELFWNKGRAFHGMNEMEQAALFFQKSYDTFAHRGEDSTTTRLKRIAKEKYGIGIE